MKLNAKTKQMKSFLKEVILDMTEQTLYNYKNELNCQQ